MPRLSDIPFYGAFTERTQQNEQAGQEDIKNAGALQAIYASIQRQQLEQQAQAQTLTDRARADAVRAKIAALPPEQRTRENVLPILMEGATPREVAGMLPVSAERGEPIGSGGLLKDGKVIPPAARPTPDKPTPTTLSRLMAEKQALPQGDPRHAIYDAAIRKESETARQISPPAPGSEPLMQVEQDDGSIVWMPRSQAAGKKVGARVKDTNLPKQVQQFGKDLQKSELSSVIPVLLRAEEITPDVAAYITGPMSGLPDRAIPPAAAQARQDVKRLFNITLKQRSGAAVTNQELDRLKDEFGQGAIKKPEQLINAIGRMREIVQSHYTSIAGGYGKDVLDAFNTNLEAVGGSRFEVRPRVASAPSASPGAPQGQQTPSWSDDKERRYQELLRKRQGGT